MAFSFCLFFLGILSSWSFIVSLLPLLVAAVNEDGCAGVALHPTVWSSGGLIERRKVRVSAWGYAWFRVPLQDPSIDIWRSCGFLGAMLRALGGLPGGLGRFIPCRLDANHCKLRSIGWEKMWSWSSV